MLAESFLLVAISLFPTILAIECDNPNISAKARKRFCSDSLATTPSFLDTFESTEDLVDNDEIDKTFDFLGLVGDQDEEEDDFYSRRDEIFRIPEEPEEFQVTLSTPPPSDFMEDDVEYCSDLMPGFDDMTNCINKTEPQVETRWRDYVFEMLISQSWRDIQRQVSEKSKFGDIHLDPLDVDSFVSGQPTVDISESTGVYSADLKMWDIQAHGLSQIFISDVLVTRSKSLYDFELKVEFQVPGLSVNGSYNLDGQVGGWFGTSFTSDGDRPFRIDVANATLSPTVKFDTSEDKMQCSKVNIFIRFKGLYYFGY